MQTGVTCWLGITKPRKNVQIRKAHIISTQESNKILCVSLPLLPLSIVLLLHVARNTPHTDALMN